ncbi:MAG TPA: TetR/AcrR family transcriptional regulator [Myxococcota bacterium]|jgi:AcrR family transcriptional regulator|nr:TetR/AcrR family transcriptional regulator [Myxococcota bacterium]
MTKHLSEEARREQILDAARTCFVERGFDAARMEDIAETAGLSKGGVYFHFRSKREVLDALVRREFTHVMATIERLTDDERPFGERIRRLAQYFVDYFTARPESARFALAVSEMATRDAGLRATLHEMQGAFHKRLTRLVENGVASGVFRADLDAESVAILLKGIMDGVEGLIAVGIAVDIDRLLTAGLDMVFRGVRVDGESGGARHTVPGSVLD